MANKTFILDKNTVKSGKFTDLKTGQPVWSDFEKPTKSEIEQVASLIGIQAQEIKELLRLEQRPLLYNEKNYSVIVTSTPTLVEDHLAVAPVLIFISKSRNDLITLHRHHVSAIDKIYSYTAARSNTVFKEGITHILFILLDEIVDSYFQQIDGLSDIIEEVEDRMFDYKKSNVIMKKSFMVKKSLILFHKALVANREVVVAIEKQYAQFLDSSKIELFTEINNHITQLIEMVATYRDILTSTIEIHLSSISNNLNITMKRVTSWGALVLVPSLIAGIFGMNFKYIPTLQSPVGFYLALTVMLLSVLLLAWYFKKRDWF